MNGETLLRISHMAAITALSRKPEIRPANSDSPIVALDRTQIIDKRDRRPLGQLLLEDGAVEPRNLLRAVMIRQRQDVPLGEILLSRGWVTPQALIQALSRQWRTSVIDLAALPPDPRLIDQLGAEFCLSAGIVPWRQVCGVTYIVTSRPEEFARHRDSLPEGWREHRMLLCSETAMRDAILASRRISLIRRAETRVAAQESCRSARPWLAAGLLAVLAASALLAPITMLALLTLWTILALLAATGLKLAAFLATLREGRRQAARKADLAALRIAAPQMKDPLPVISVMVPLFAESDIANRLIARLSRLTYPRELTDLILVVEESDGITCKALETTALPRWMRVVKVPDGPIKTKPRALNYALNFCRGGIVGVWDAEDRPEPDQLHKVARHFHFAAPDVACVQGVLDYYNPRTNWLARCFTIEYASWFRANLRGVASLGLVVPLGGTTLFFRRHALESVGCWDAWNVTEDADLGVRLARRGWRTEMIDTVTHEEANCRALPWVKQRSRWLKGYALTWAVHMRNPLKLLRDLGTRRFIGFQVQFLGAISLYLLAPVLWSFWLLAFGLPHPLGEGLRTLWNGGAIPALFALFIASELLSVAIGIWAVRGTAHRHLIPWVPTMHLYFPLGCLAGWKAIYEVVAKPFYWDKTAHGLFDGANEPGSKTRATIPPGGANKDVPLAGRIF